ncbi:hypothetical protein OC846_004120 [Tilletia horrida]|uniref:Aminoglycoside phosphotransferase domain-containing protein n=1 Tax=Tilletia horrida TaxID=155126 RepID=A0AAN6GR19_9BASI|nr:hypothetical protein OC846_004120 [Tilletia horrida]
MSSALDGIAISDDAIRILYRARLGKEVACIAAPKDNAGGQMHKIYLVDLHDQTRTVLRISRRSAEEDRTEVEVATLAYISERSPIPIPAPKVLFWSADPKASELGRPYTAMTRLSGQTLSNLLGGPVTSDSPSTSELRAIATQVSQVQLALCSIPLPEVFGNSQSIGALQLCRSQDSSTLHEGNFTMGPFFDEYMIEQDSLQRFWSGTGATLADLNIAGPYSTWTEATSAWIKNYIFMIKTHPSLDASRSLLPRLEALVARLANSNITRAFQKDHKDAVELAHNDLHAGNILVERQPTNGPEGSTWRFSGILDWEFAASYPSFLNPRRNFLHPMTTQGELLQKRGVDGDGQIFAPEAFDIYLRSRTATEDPSGQMQRARRHALEHSRFASRLNSPEGNDEQTPLQILSMLRNYLRAITEVCVQESDNQEKVRLAQTSWTRAVLDRLDQVEAFIETV